MPENKQEAFERRFQEALRKLRNMVASNSDLLDELSQGFYFDRRHLAAVIDDGASTKVKRRLKGFIIDYVIDNSAKNIFYTMSSMLNASTDSKNYADLKGHYRYYRYAPMPEKFEFVVGRLAIKVVEGVPYLFQQSQNLSRDSLFKTDIDGNEFLYDFKGTLVRSGRNIFCFSSGSGKIRWIIFQLPREVEAEDLSLKEALSCRHCSGAVLSCLPTSDNPFAAKAYIYHESFIGPRPGGKAIEPEMMYSSYFTGFLFGNTDDIPQAFRPPLLSPD